MKILFLILCLGLSQLVYADEWDDAIAAYEKGDYVTAFNLIRPFAEQGDSGAQYNLALMYSNGLGVTQDYKEAVKWYRKAAGQGVVLAQYNLGGKYSNGQGVTQDYKEAVKWYRMAAEQGDASAQYNLGRKYSSSQGVIQDYIQAHAWFNLAASQGNAVSLKNRDIVAKRMTPDQIAKAQALAREWAAKYNE